MAGAGRAMRVLWRRGVVAWCIGLKAPTLLGIWLGLALVVGAAASACLGFAIGVPLAGAVAGATAVWAWPMDAISAQRRLQRAMEGLETERLVLRGPVPGDAAALAATIDASVIEANGWPDRVGRQLCRDVAGGLTTVGLARVLVTDKRSGEVLGSVEAHRAAAPQPTCEVGWWMGPAARGRGYGTEALQAVFRSLHAAGIAFIVVGTLSDNMAVLRVLEKLGAREASRTLHRLPNRSTVPSIWYVHADAAAVPQHPTR